MMPSIPLHDHVKDLGSWMSTKGTSEHGINDVVQRASSMSRWILRTFYSRSPTLRVRSNQQNIPGIFHKEVERKHNKQLHTEEYSIEYFSHEQQLICEVISGIFLGCSARSCLPS